jgi:hypothetical protein
MRPLPSGSFPLVMAGVIPAIHVFAAVKTWMPGTRPGHDAFRRLISLDAS